MKAKTYEDSLKNHVEYSLICVTERGEQLVCSGYRDRASVLTEMYRRVNQDITNYKTFVITDSLLVGGTLQVITQIYDGLGLMIEPGYVNYTVD